MDTTQERRTNARRTTLRLPVELGHPREHGRGVGVQDRFSAASIDVSTGGMAMSATCLPDVGDRLACRIPGTPERPAVTATGEVVWARVDGERAGEFGLRFVDLDAGATRLIEQMLGEGHSTDAGLGPSVVPAATSLELDGFAEPIAAHVDDQRGFATFEQPLDLYKLGRVVRRRGTRARSEGSIAKVELRLLGNTPMLAITVDFDGNRPVSELELELDADAARASEAVLAEVAELEASPSAGVDFVGNSAGELAVTEPRARFSHVTQTEFAMTEPVDQEVPAIETVASDARQSPDTSTVLGMGAAIGLAASAPLAADAPVDESLIPTWNPDLPVFTEPVALRDTAPDLDAGASTAAEVDDECVTVALAAAATRLAQPSSAFVLERESALETEARVRAPRLVDELDAEIEAMAALRRMRGLPQLMASLAALADRALPMWRRAVGSLRVKLAATYETAAPRLASALQRVLPPVRGFAFRVRSTLGTFYLRSVAPSFGATRRLIVGGLRRRRRTMAASATGEHEEILPAGVGLGRRWIPMALIGTVAVGVGAYALTPALGANIGGAATAGASTSAAAPRARAKAKAASRAKATAKAASAPALPSAATLPATSAYAVDVREGGGEGAQAASAAPSAPAVATTPVVFGAREVPRAQRFTLRMTGNVVELRGVRDADGFTVTIPGSRSIDRAGPIGEQHPSVASARILNRGDQSQLTIRFAPGKQPVYQVRGQGAQIEILIEGA